MIQKCSLFNVLEVFFREPTAIHFIREISRTVKLAPTSVKIHISELLSSGLIKTKKSKPFNGLAAHRENDKFLFYKRAYNLYTLYNLKERIKEEISPRAIILFGSYSRGEDIESSDIDIVVLSKTKKEVKIDDIGKKLGRKINIMLVDDLSKLDRVIIEKLNNGITLEGEL